MKAPKTRVNPRLSLNKLAQYLSASPAQRRTILKQQKTPPAYLVTWYADAEKAIEKFLLGQCSDIQALKDTASKLASKIAVKDNEKTKYQTNAAALSRFISALPKLNLQRFTFSSAPQSAPKLIFSGVELSVQPDMLLSGQDRKGVFSGCLKFHFSKDKPFDDDTAAYVGAVLYEFSRKNGANGSACRPSTCCVLDVFGGELYEGPKATTKRLKEVEAACQEIATMWPAI